MTRGIRTVAPAIAVGALLLAACSDTVAPDDSLRVKGVLQVTSGSSSQENQAPPDGPISWDIPPGEGTMIPPEAIAAPDSVDAGEAFSITVTTIGATGCWSADGQDDDVGSHVIEITPFDRHSGANVCTDNIMFLPHEKSFTLGESGEWTIRALGRRVRTGSPEEDGPVVAERTLFVR